MSVTNDAAAMHAARASNGKPACNIVVIGGGASGLAAAITAARSVENVTMFEADERVGKKLLATGNGRCNLTNMNVDFDAYNAPEFVMPTLVAHSPNETRVWFEQLGLLTVEEREGRVFPVSNSASSVVDVLRNAAQRLGVHIVTKHRVDALADVKADATVVACGGGSTLLASAGHTIVPAQPVLCSLACEDMPRGLAGVRSHARLSVVPAGASVDNATFSAIGEVQFRDYGVSGIVAFDASRYVQPGDELVLQLMPQRSRHDVYMLLHRRYVQFARDEDIDVGTHVLSCTYAQFMAGMFHSRVNAWLLKAAGINPDERFDEAAVECLVDAICEQRLRVSGCGDAQHAQLTRGGAALDEFESVTLKSKLGHNVFACGEALDVDACCGGYNLQWAWASGRVAGESAASAIDVMRRRTQSTVARGALIRGT